MFLEVQTKRIEYVDYNVKDSPAAYTNNNTAYKGLLCLSTISAFNFLLA